MIRIHSSKLNKDINSLDIFNAEENHINLCKKLSVVDWFKGGQGKIGQDGLES